MKRHLAAAPAIVAAAVLALAGCGADGGSDASGGTNGPSVVATTTQVADFTRNVAGDSAAVTQLIQANQSAHGYEPSAADLLALADADALVINGVGLEEWLDDAVTASGFDGVLIDASDGIAISEEQAGHAHEGGDHATDEHAVDEHAEDEHAAEEHAHGAGNAHIWTDPNNAIAMVETIASGLSDVEGADADAIGENADAYTAQLSALDEWIVGNTESVPADERLLVSNHDAFGYFIDRYGITYVGSVIPSFDDNAEPSAAEIDALVAAIQQTGARAVFSETSISPKTAETIANEAGVAVYADENALYGDSLGADGSSGDTYIASQVHNVSQLLESWGRAPTELPPELQH